MNETTVIANEQESFIKNLRIETAESHQILENNQLSKTLLDPAVTLSDYQAYLSKIYGITLACELQIFPVLKDILPDWNSRYKSALIVKDLSRTGMSDDQIRDLPIHQFDCSGTPEAMGIMYVMEGSTLGGKIIYKHVHNKLGLDPESGAAYFWGYGDQTGSMWKSFVSLLAQYAAGSKSSATIIDSAKKTFTVINSWLSDRNI
ncbi:biliverdin-producing heme oxygenase [Dyadobacter sp. Leaf189]|uniref:biliverdin-producing heme oxygenase n=1 Tax=Dyadobacter sp. Leaf189 TaxID=1736295 RepID=UPI0006F25F68|nr:biliverdin-producing heme oxygenase [Dyadobacter sp. Leaf189]KQS24820.1 heme oxygenase [Dyadobacter sp. Leaf189]